MNQSQLWLLLLAGLLFSCTEPKTPPASEKARKPELTSTHKKDTLINTTKSSLNGINAESPALLPDTAAFDIILNHAESARKKMARTILKWKVVISLILIYVHPTKKQTLSFIFIRADC